MTEAKAYNNAVIKTIKWMNNSSIVLIALFFAFAGCTKYIDNTSSGSSSSGGITTPVTVPVTGGSTGGTTGTTTGGVYIKFYGTLVNYGQVSVSLNSSRVATVSVNYPSTYIAALNGLNNIQIADNTGTVLNVNTPLTPGYYSCFVYKVGYDYKISVVYDNLTGLVNGFCGVRVLDFRTQAYYTPLFLNTRIYYPGNAYELNQKGRHFLDVTTNSSLTNFTQLTAGSYNIVLYNDSTNFSRINYTTFAQGKFYSILLCTSPADSVNASLYNITLDIEQHN